MTAQTLIPPSTAERDVACERAIMAVRAFADMCSAAGEIHAAQTAFLAGADLVKLRRPDVAHAIELDQLERARLVA